MQGRLWRRIDMASLDLAVSGEACALARGHTIVTSAFLSAAASVYAMSPSANGAAIRSVSLHCQKLPEPLPTKFLISAAGHHFAVVQHQHTIGYQFQELDVL